MNIFIMFLVALFMVGFYMMDGPSQRISEQDTEYAITRADLRTIAQCTAAKHNAQINGTVFDDICISQNEIISEYICMNDSYKIVECEIVRGKKPAFSYIVTATAPIDATNHNSMMQVLEQYYPDSGTFGLFFDNQIMSGGTSSKRTVPESIISAMELIDGQLVYMTQYEMPDALTEYDLVMTDDIICPVGTAKTYRFGRWQCVSYNTKINCGGDMIWDSDLMQCIPDVSRKPLCAESQNAVIVDDVWECVDPFADKVCPDNMVARLNYSTLEWECVSDPTKTQNTTKCAHLTGGAIYGTVGATLRIPRTSCTSCEKMLINYDDCTYVCVPDVDKIASRNCYPGAPAACSGPSRAFYFGFPNREYLANVDAVSASDVPFDAAHSQNRHFNCMDCGAGVIDTDASNPPFTAICK